MKTAFANKLRIKAADSQEASKEASKVSSLGVASRMIKGGSGQKGDGSKARN